jgi:hypothetical protein
VVHPPMVRGSLPGWSDNASIMLYWTSRECQLVSSRRLGHDLVRSVTRYWNTTVDYRTKSARLLFVVRPTISGMRKLRYAVDYSNGDTQHCDESVTQAAVPYLG